MLSGISPQRIKKKNRWNFGKRNIERVINYSVQIHLHINKSFFFKLAWGIKTWGSYKKISKASENIPTVLNFTNCFSLKILRFKDTFIVTKICRLKYIFKQNIFTFYRNINNKTKKSYRIVVCCSRNNFL